MRFTNVNWLSPSPSTPANMASADPAVTASPNGHVGIANVRRDATKVDARFSIFTQLVSSPKIQIPDHAHTWMFSHLEKVDGEILQVSVIVSFDESPMHLFHPKSVYWPTVISRESIIFIVSPRTHLLRNNEGFARRFSFLVLVSLFHFSPRKHINTY